MQLKSVRIENYRSISDSGVVPIDSTVTCLVGKNESGKTAFLRALHLLNPLNPIKGKKEFDPPLDMPAKDYGRMQTEGAEPNVVTTIFELNPEEMAAIADEFGENFLQSSFIEVSRGYSGETSYKMETDESEAVAHVQTGLQLLPTDDARLVGVQTFEGLHQALSEVDEPHSAVTTLLSRIGGWENKDPKMHVIGEYLSEWLPGFFYFDEYSSMPGRISIDGFQQKLTNGAPPLTEGEEAFLAFLKLGGVELSQLQGTTRTEEIIRRLENAGIAITAEAMHFWSQNDNLVVEVRETKPDPNDADPTLRVGTNLSLRIRNNAQFGVSSAFEERSRGFVWFFSFLAYFTGIERRHADSEVILLLDEPGLSLHGSAQADFLRFINERLGKRHQVLYTTHSPFLVEGDRLERVRTVEDTNPQRGTVVSEDILRSEPGTALPILTKMGVELYQTLMVAENTLLVEGSSDFLYLRLLSAELERRGRTGLNASWVLVPVAGIGRFESFFRLYRANRLNTVVLMDSSSRDQKLLDSLTKASEKKRVIQIGDVTGTGDADIEDLLGADFYTELVTQTYDLDPIDASDITSQNPRVVKRLEQYFKDEDIAGGLSHNRPAVYLRDHTEMLASLSTQALDHAEELIRRVNSFIKAFK